MEEATLRRRLSERGMQATEGWLAACIDYFKSSNQRYTAKELEGFVFDQWLLVDLREFKIASFPPNLAEQTKIQLTGHYTCQVESVLDIGHSSYSQYQKISKQDTTNLDVDTDADTFQKKWDPKPSKTMMLYICDGVQELRALEFKPVSVLNTSIIPGTKVIIKGPVLCRRGIIMLENKNINLLGGEVDKLLIPNAYQNILATCLELPLNPDPYNLGVNNGSETGASAQQNGNNSPARTTTRGENRPAPPVNQVQHGGANMSNTLMRSAPQQRTQTESAIRKYPSIEDDFDDDEALLNINLDFEIELHAREQDNKVQNFGEGTSRNVHAREQPGRNPLTSHRPDKTSSNNNWNHNPGFPNQQNNRTFEEGSTSNQRGIGHPKRGNITSHPADRATSNALNSGAQNHRSTSRGDGTSNVTVYGGGQSKSNTSAPQPAKSPAFLIEDDDDILLAAESIDSGVSTLNKSHATPTHQDRAKPSTSISEPRGVAIRQQNDAFSDEDIYVLDEGIDDEALLRVVNVQAENKEADASVGAPARHVSRPENKASSPFVNLANVKDILGRINQRTRVRVKAVIIKVTEKISISNEEWRLGVQITDGSSNLTVRFSSEVVSRLFELTPAELSIRKKAASHDPVKKAELKKHFERGQTKLLSIDKIFEIDLTPDQAPLVVNILQLTAEDVVELRKPSLSA